MAQDDDSSAFTISALSVASELSFLSQPTSVWQFGTFSVAVGVDDQFGNPVTGNTSTVTLSIESGGPAGSECLEQP